MDGGGRWIEEEDGWRGDGKRTVNILLTTRPGQTLDEVVFDGCAAGCALAFCVREETFGVREGGGEAFDLSRALAGTE